MVLSKEQVYNATINTFKKAFESIEGTINSKLKRGTTIIPTNVITSALKSEYRNDWVVKDEFLEYVICKYKQVGWTIKRENGYDQKDNTSWDYLTFS